MRRTVTTTIALTTAALTAVGALAAGTAVAASPRVDLLDPMPAGTFRVVHVAADDQLNARQLPGVQNRVVAHFNSGFAGLHLTGNRAKVGSTVWDQVSLPRSIGWVADRYVMRVVAAASGVTAWPVEGNRATAARVPATSVLRAMAAAEPRGFGTPTKLHALWSGRTLSGATATVVTATAGTHTLAAAWVVPAGARAGQVEAVHDVARNAAQVSVVLRDRTAVVVGEPGTGQILYRNPGANGFGPAPGSERARWAAFQVPTWRAGPPVTQIMVLDGDGDLTHPMYRGPIGVGLTFPDV